MLLDRWEAAGSFGLCLDHDPQVHTHRNAIYVPKRFNFDPQTGVFTETGYLIPQAALFHRRPAEMKGHCLVTPLDVTAEYPVVPRAIYVGHIDLHYGHTLTEFVSRLWSLSALAEPGRKLLFHSIHDRERILRCGWMMELLSLLAIDTCDLISFDTPVRIEDLVVPAPAFGENNYVHRVFGDYCRGIGERARALPEHSADLPSDVPVYLTRAQLGQGTMTISNEDALCDALASRGFAILVPETLSIRAQMRLFGPGCVVTGMIGSAFHTSIFGAGSSALCLTPADPSDNFLLMDRYSDVRTRYFRFDAEHSERKEAFFKTLTLPDPKRMADELSALALPLVDHSRVRRKAGQMMRSAYEAAATEKRTDFRYAAARSDPRLLPPSEHGENLLGLVETANQSSRSPWSHHPDRALDAAAALGSCTGGYAFHTDLDDPPWWSVRFRQRCVLTEIRLYNRMDMPAHAARADPIRIEVQHDDGTWEILLERHDPVPFGGADGHPLVWRAGNVVATRELRVSLLRRDYLHLDAVELFGRPMVEA